MDKRISNLAKTLVLYSIKAKKGEEVVIRGSYEARELIHAVYEELIKVGAHPRVKVTLPGMDYSFYKYAKDHQLDFVSDVDYLEADKMAALIRIKSDYNTKELSSIDPKKMTRQQKAHERIRKTIMDRVRWNVTLFPTHSLAQDAEMSLAEYQDFVYKAVYADQENPLKCWEELSKKQQSLCDHFNQGKEIRIVGQDTDITMKVEGRTFINSDGTHNMPSGEIFSAPIENSVNGKVSFDFPVCLMGKEVEGVELEFKDGKVINYSAKKNYAFLDAMLNADEGARYLGEIGIGNNYGIDKFTKNILFDEKIGGTIHLAVGQSYAECGGKNTSAIHWDMIKDLREGGEMYLDGELVQKNGKFLI